MSIFALLTLFWLINQRIDKMGTIKSVCPVNCRRWELEDIRSLLLTSRLHCRCSCTHYTLCWNCLPKVWLVHIAVWVHSNVVCYDYWCFIKAHRRSKIYVYFTLHNWSLLMLILLQILPYFTAISEVLIILCVPWFQWTTNQWLKRLYFGLAIGICLKNTPMGILLLDGEYIWCLYRFNLDWVTFIVCWSLS